MQKKYILPLCLLLQIALIRIVAFFPGLVEDYYSNGFYPYWSAFERLLFGWLPFSFGDIMYGILILLALKWLWNNRRNWKLKWKDRLLQVAGVLSIAYCFFHFSWAMNYYRVPLREKLGLEKEYSEAQLVGMIKKLIVKTNDIHFRITHDKDKKVLFPYGQEAVFDGNVKGYENLSKTFPGFAYRVQSTKKSLISLPLTYMGFSGYLNPFTGEAQVNGKIPMYQFPMTSAHEMAHQVGYASESEANFIGFEASIHNDDLYYQYSGYAFALRYCLSTLEAFGEGKSKPFLEQVHPGILANYRDSRLFWDSYQTFVESGFKAFYDRFLKMNSQQDGLESYSKFVNLLVNYYDKKDF